MYQIYMPRHLHQVIHFPGEDTFRREHTHTDTQKNKKKKTQKKPLRELRRRNTLVLRENTLWGRNKKKPLRELRRSNTLVLREFVVFFGIPGCVLQVINLFVSGHYKKSAF